MVRGIVRLIIAIYLTLPVLELPLRSHFFLVLSTPANLLFPARATLNLTFTSP